MEKRLVPKHAAAWSTIAMVIFEHIKWLAGSLTFIRVCSQAAAFQPCSEDNACLYIVIFSREHQPSSIHWSSNFPWISNPFFVITNASSFPSTWNVTHAEYSNPTSEDTCNSADIRKHIIMDLKWQTSMMALMAFLVVDFLLMIAHDMILLYASSNPEDGEFDDAERQACRIGYVSWIAWGLACVSAMFWAVGFAETFVALDAQSRAICLYQLETISMLVSAATVFTMYAKFQMRTQKLWRASLLGDHLYAFNDQVPIRFVRANVLCGCMRDATSTMQIPIFVADKLAINREPPHQPVHVHVDIRTFLHEHIRNDGGWLLCWALFLLLQYILLPGTRDLPIVNALCTLLFITILCVTTWWRYIAKEYHENISNDVGQHAADLKLLKVWAEEHIISSISRLSRYAFIASCVWVILARAGFLLLSFCPWLGPSTPSPDRALAIGLDLTILMVTSTHAYQVYVRTSFLAEVYHWSKFNESSRSHMLSMLNRHQILHIPWRYPLVMCCCVILTLRVTTSVSIVRRPCDFETGLRSCHKFLSL